MGENREEAKGGEHGKWELNYRASSEVNINLFYEVLSFFFLKKRNVRPLYNVYYQCSYRLRSI